MVNRRAAITLFLFYVLVGPWVGGALGYLSLVALNDFIPPEGFDMWSLLFASYVAGLVPALGTSLYLIRCLKRGTPLRLRIYYSIALLGVELWPFWALMMTFITSISSGPSLWIWLVIFGIPALIALLVARLLLFLSSTWLARRYETRNLEPVS